MARHQRGDVDAAATEYRALMQEAPRCFDVLQLLGVALVQQGALAEGSRLIRKAIEIDPGRAHAHGNLSKVALDMGDLAAALAAGRRATALDPTVAESWYNLGNAQMANGELDDAVESYRRALALRPAYSDALNNLGNALRQSRRPGEALDALTECLRLAPGYADAHNNAGLALQDLGRSAEALAAFDRALALSPRHVAALNNRGNVCMQNRQPVEAAEAFMRLLDAAPDYMYAPGNLLHARMQSCDWRGHAALAAELVQRVGRGERVDFPFSFLCVSHDAALQLACARTYTQDQYPAQGARNPGRRRPHDRIRIAYVSGDFGDHAVSYLLAGVIETHDRTAFETTAISWGRQGEGAMRHRLEAAFDRFVDVSGLSDAQIVGLMRDLEIDIAVDLTGHTRGNRTGIFARRAAPVQVNFLGLPATMGAPYMDYLIADRYLVPEDHRSKYVEAIVWLPDTFQPNDARRVTASPTTRATLGLPHDALVVSCFNSTAKLNPTMFDIWMRVLRSVPQSVLWLVAGEAQMMANLRREAAARDVDPDRLVFAPRTDYASYLGQYAHASLFLDSLPFNAGTTASDALSQGVPVLTCSGEAFASRMAGSLLHCLGLPELVASSLADYEQRALALLEDPARLASLRAVLNAKRVDHPFFNMARYRRHLERAFATMWQRAQRGTRPEAFAVAAEGVSLEVPP